MQNIFNKLDLIVDSTTDENVVLDAGLPFLLEADRSDFSNVVCGQFIMNGRKLEIEDDQREKYLIEQVYAINSAEQLKVKLSEIVGDTEFLSCAEFPNLKFIIGSLNRTDRTLLDNGEYVNLRLQWKQINAEAFTDNQYIPLISMPHPQLTKNNIYKVLITGYSKNRINVECNGLIGYISSQFLPAADKDDFDTKYPIGTFIDAYFIKVEEAGIYNQHLFSLIPKQTDFTLKFGTYDGYFNKYDEKQLQMFVDIDEYVAFPAFYPHGLNIKTWVASEFLKPGQKIKLKVEESTIEEYRSKITFIPPKEDVFDLKKGEIYTAKLRKDSPYLRFTAKGKNYSLFAANSEHQWIKSRAFDIYPNEDIPVRIDIMHEYTFRDEQNHECWKDPKIFVNSTKKFFEEHPNGMVVDVKVCGLVDEFYVLQCDGFWFEIHENRILRYMPYLYRPKIGSSIHALIDDNRLIMQYDRFEPNYMLPDGNYSGRIIDSYSDWRFVIETTQGKVVAKPEAYISKYILLKFLDIDTKVDVTVKDNLARFSISRLNCQMPYKEDPIQAEVIDARHGGLIVRIGDAYGAIPPEYIEWRTSYAIDENSYIGKVVEVNMLKGTNNQLLFSLRKGENPYLKKGLKIDDVVNVRLIDHSTLELDVDGLSGHLYFKFDDYFRTPQGGPAIFEGESFKAKVNEIDPEHSKLELSLAIPLPTEGIRNLQKTFEKNKYYDVEVLGFCDSNMECVIVECNGARGCINKRDILIDKILFRPWYFKPGKKIKLKLISSLLNKHILYFDGCERLFDKISSEQIKAHTHVRAKIIDQITEGFVAQISLPEIGTLPAIMTNAAADEMSTKFAIDDEFDAVIAYVDNKHKAIYLTHKDSPLYALYHLKKDTRLIGKVIRFDPTTGYEILFDKGMKGLMSKEFATHNFWSTDVLSVGASYEFAVKSAEISKHCLLLNRNTLLDNPWKNISLKIKDHIRFTITGIYGKHVNIEHSGIRDWLDSGVAAEIIGRPWERDYIANPSDFPIGTEFDAIIKLAYSTNSKYLHYVLEADRLADIKALETKAHPATIVHINSDGLWVKINNSLPGIVRNENITHAHTDNPTQYFKVGDTIHVKVASKQHGAYAELSRKELVLSAKKIPKNTKATVSHIGQDSVLAIADGVEISLPKSIFGKNVKKGTKITLNKDYE